MTARGAKHVSLGDLSSPTTPPLKANDDPVPGGGRWHRRGRAHESVKVLDGALADGGDQNVIDRRGDAVNAKMLELGRRHIGGSLGRLLGIAEMPVGDVDAARVEHAAHHAARHDQPRDDLDVLDHRDDDREAEASLDLRPRQQLILGSLARTDHAESVRPDRGLGRSVEDLSVRVGDEQLVACAHRTEDLIRRGRAHRRELLRRDADELSELEAPVR
jgi:hypothetical protein